MLPERYAPLGRLNVVCPYYTMFPLKFPYTVLKSAAPQSQVFDPFCGRGTTLYASRLLNLPCVGVDSNPVAAAIAAAKLVNVKAQQVISLCEKALKYHRRMLNLPEGEFWDWCFHRDTLIEICILRDYLMTEPPSAIVIALRALLLGVLHGPIMKTKPSYLSNQMPRTYSTKPDAAVDYWWSRQMRPPRVNTLDVVRRRAEYIFEEVPSSVQGRVVTGDIRHISLRWERRFTHVITSPPYLGMRSYVPDQWLRNWFLGKDDDVLYDQCHQLGLSTRDSFIQQLATVWRRVAQICVNGARLVIRFGALPGLEEEPSDVIRESLSDSGAAWKVKTVRHVLPPPKAGRQAHQFVEELEDALTEVDVYAVLEP